LSKLTKAKPVYRGVSGGVLPKTFWEPNAQGVKGGIESAFMSTTFDRKVAMQYASSEQGKPALLFEMQMGMIDRGAELDWCSQYPHEEECLCEPSQLLNPCGSTTCTGLILTCVPAFAQSRRSRGSRCRARVSRAQCESSR
jgi:hypothetical protein